MTTQYPKSIEELYGDADRIERRRQEYIAALREDPLMIRWASRLEPGWRANSAADVIGEQHAYAYLLLSRPEEFIGIPTNKELENGRIMTAEAIGLAIAANIVHAPAFLWRDQIRNAAAMAPLPEHQVDRSVLPMSSMWWSFESGITIEGGVIDACLVSDANVGFTTVFVGSMNPRRVGERSGQLFIFGVDVTYGKMYGGDLHDPTKTKGDNGDNVTGILSLLSFLNSPYSEEEQLELSHSQRRTWKNGNPGKPSPGVSMIKMRQRHVRNIGSEPGTGEVNWQHQWWIRGHHRNQWYPSTGTHKVIYIPAFIKGPSDKPFMIHVYDVVR